MNAYPWHKSYTEGIPFEIDEKQPQSLIEFLEGVFEEFGDKTAYENMGVGISYRELDKLSKNFSNFLTHDLGLKKGDRMAIQLPNILQFPIALFGAIRSGIVVVNTNPLYTSAEMKHQFNDSGAKAVVILSNFAKNLEEILPETQIEHVVLTQLGDQLGTVKGALVNFVVKNIKKMVPNFHLSNTIPFKEALKKGAKYQYKKPKIKAKDLGFLQYTGGTTGVSKGAMLTHSNLLANLAQAEIWFSSSKLEKGKEIFITALPMYHIFALTANVFVCAKLGAKSVLITNPRDMKGFVKELKKHKYTTLTGVNTLFNGLLNTPGFDQIDHSHIKLVIGGGMAVQRFVAEKWNKITQSNIAEGYGLTETSPVLTLNPLDGREKIGYIGLPVPSTHIIMVNDEGEEVPYGEPGELCAKGPQVMSGYWNKPEATKEAFLGEYFKTGDIAIQDSDGFIKIVDRKKEMILVSGFNVYPNEVEDCVAMLDEVVEVGAIGVPDKKSTEAVKVYVVRQDESLTEERIIEHCKKTLTAYKCPKYVAFTDVLPKSNVGKILRRILKEEDLKKNTYL